MPREAITVQVGQCGIQLGTQFWDLALREHAANNEDGVYDEALSTFFSNVDARSTQVITNVDQIQRSQKLGGVRSSVVLPIGSGTSKISSLQARALLVDMEQGVINNLLKSPFAELFPSPQLIRDIHGIGAGSGNNWSHGHCVYGPKYTEYICDTLQGMCESCDSLQSFFLMHSLGGGTGSGLGSFILELLDDQFPEIYRFVAGVFPSENDDVVTSPYNSVLCLRELIEFADCVLPIENGALINIHNKIKGLPGSEGLTSLISHTVDLMDRKAVRSYKTPNRRTPLQHAVRGSDDTRVPLHARRGENKRRNQQSRGNDSSSNPHHRGLNNRRRGQSHSLTEAPRNQGSRNRRPLRTRIAPSAPSIPGSARHTGSQPAVSMPGRPSSHATTQSEQVNTSTQGRFRDYSNDVDLWDADEFVGVRGRKEVQQRSSQGPSNNQQPLSDTPSRQLSHSSHTATLSGMSAREQARAAKELKAQAFAEMNAIAGHVLTNLTASMRFPGELNVDLNEITMNLVPYPRMHFLVPGVAPLYTLSGSKQGSSLQSRGGRVPIYNAQRIRHMFTSVLRPDSQVVSVDVARSTWLACGLLTRGDVSISELRRNVDALRPKLRMAPFNDDGFKVGLCSTPPPEFARSLLCLSNSTGMADCFGMITERFHKLYKVRAHVHHYEQFMEGALFDEAIGCVEELRKDYQSVGKSHRLESKSREGILSPTKHTRGMLAGDVHGGREGGSIAEGVDGAGGRGVTSGNGGRSPGAQSRLYALFQPGGGAAVPVDRVYGRNGREDPSSFRPLF